mmetsp:Transcript_32040/g.32306  ORF Transcript_32040/g.32306 Transcript_32040/m.32306 type:complete len:93 (-) Transcript_32040:628-906(-)
MKRGLDSSATDPGRRKRFQRVMNELFDDSMKNQMSKDRKRSVCHRNISLRRSYILPTKYHLPNVDPLYQEDFNSFHFNHKFYSDFTKPTNIS